MVQLWKNIDLDIMYEGERDIQMSFDEMMVEWAEQNLEMAGRPGYSLDGKSMTIIVTDSYTVS